MKKMQNRLEQERNYAENLAAALSELCVTKTELASALNIDPKTAARYVNGETFPKKHIISIGEYLYGRSHIKRNDLDLRHIPSAEFTPLFGRIMNALSAAGVSEEEFARKINSSQTTLNNYRNAKGALLLSVEAQYNIIEGFFALARGDNDVDEQLPEIKELIAYISEHYMYRVSRQKKYADSIMLSALEKNRFNYFFLTPEKLRFVKSFLDACTAFYEELEDKALEDGCADIGAKVSVALTTFDGIGKTNRESPDFLGDFSENSDIVKMFLKEELDAVYYDLKLLYLQETRKIKSSARLFNPERAELYETYEDISHDSDEFFPKEDFTRAEELFATLPVPLQELILRDFSAFFGLKAINTYYAESTADLKSWTVWLSYDDKLKFVELFENELIGGLFNTVSDEDNIGAFEISRMISQYFDLMAYADNKGILLNTEKTDDKTAKRNAMRFRRYSAGISAYDSPYHAIIKRVRASALDWYIYMLLDIAAIKGIDMFDRLFGEIGMFYSMDDYIRYHNARSRPRTDRKSKTDRE